MNEPQATNTERILGAILAGCVTVIITSIALFPLGWLVFDNFFEFHFGDTPDGYWINILIIAAACAAWVFASMMAGGYVAARIALQNEYQVTWTIIGIGFLIFIVYAGADVAITLILSLAGILGGLAGCHSGIKYKKRKNKNSDQRSR